MTSSGIVVWLVVRTLEVQINLEDDDIVLRVELLQRQGELVYRVRIWRIEFFRLQSTFPQENGEPRHAPSDEAILKEFEGMECPYAEPTSFAGIEAAEHALLQYLDGWKSGLVV